MEDQNPSACRVDTADGPEIGTWRAAAQKKKTLFSGTTHITERPFFGNRWGTSSRRDTCFSCRKLSLGRRKSDEEVWSSNLPILGRRSLHDGGSAWVDVLSSRDSIRRHDAALLSNTTCWRSRRGMVSHGGSRRRGSRREGAWTKSR